MITQDQSWIGIQFWNDLNQNNTQPNNNFMSETWRDAWTGVQRANTLLSDLERFRQDYAQESDTEAHADMKQNPGY